jgi:hypothetical protein
MADAMLTLSAAMLPPCAMLAKYCSAIKDYLKNILQPIA